VSNSTKLIDSAVLAGIVLFVGAAASWYFAIPLGLAGIYFLFLRKRALVQVPASQRQTQVIDDLDNPDGRISIANSYHRLLHRD